MEEDLAYIPPASQNFYPNCEYHHIRLTLSTHNSFLGSGEKSHTHGFVSTNCDDLVDSLLDTNETNTERSIKPSKAGENHMPLPTPEKPPQKMVRFAEIEGVLIFLL